MGREGREEASPMMDMFLILIVRYCHGCAHVSKHIKLCTLNRCGSWSVNYTSIKLIPIVYGFGASQTLL